MKSLLFHLNEFRNSWIKSWSIWIGLVCIAALAGCGGGGSAGEESIPPKDDIVVVSGANGEGNLVKFVEQTPSGMVYSATPFSKHEKSLLHSPTTAEVSVLATGNDENGEIIQPRDAPVIPAACKMYTFSYTSKCWLPAEGYYDVQPGAGPSDISPLYAGTGCTEVAVGTSVAAVLPAPGGMKCFQYVVNASATVASQVILPAGVTGIAELYHLLPNYLGIKATADARSPADPLNVSFTSAYHRFALMVEPATAWQDNRSASASEYQQRHCRRRFPTI